MPLRHTASLLTLVLLMVPAVAADPLDYVDLPNPEQYAPDIESELLCRVLATTEFLEEYVTTPPTVEQTEVFVREMFKCGTIVEDVYCALFSEVETSQEWLAPPVVEFNEIARGVFGFTMTGYALWERGNVIYHRFTFEYNSHGSATCEE